MNAWWWRWWMVLRPLRVACVVALAGTGTLAGAVVMQHLQPEPQAAGVLDADPATLAALGLAIDAQGVLDSDFDGIPDAQENLRYGTDPHNASTTGIPIPDGWLVRFGYDASEPLLESRPAALPPVDRLPPAYGNAWPPRFHASLLDVYSHGRPVEWNESRQGPYDSGLDPRAWDSDSDGIPDGWLMAYGLDPLGAVGNDRAAGAGGLTVAEAFQHNTDPTTLDTDGDGLTDVEEILGPVDGTRAGERFPPSDPTRFDSGGAGVCDGFLARQGLDPTVPLSSHGDQDRDGASTAEEYGWSVATFGSATCSGGAGLSARDPTSGGSTIPDGWLIAHGMDPLAAGVDSLVTQAAATDARPPGAPPPAVLLSLTVLDEYKVGRPPQWNEAADGPWWGGTDPSSMDSDQDGLGDAYEMAGYPLEVQTQPGAPLTPVQSRSDPTRSDSDSDGLSDAVEAVRGTHAGRQDTDFDGLSDARESTLPFNLDPRKADSAGDFLRDGARLAILEDRYKAYQADTRYEYPGTPAGRRVTDWLREVPGATDLAGGQDPSMLPALALLELLLPGQDMDGDGRPNVLDADIDGDGVLNGPEVEPSLYARTAHGLGPLGFRSATDPLNPDTDGDGLPEEWEVLHGRLAGTRLGLDPAKWDADADGVADGQEDPDQDGIVWHAYVPHRVDRPYVFTNLQELAFATDPNDPQTDGDGLLDGWKAFWGVAYAALDPATRGQVYPNAAGVFHVPATAPRPSLGTPQHADDPAARLYTYDYWRYSDTKDGLLPFERFSSSTPDHTVDVRRPGGSVLRLYNITADDAVMTMQEAQQRGLNPYLRDTDGDGAPDWWEGLATFRPPGLRVAEGRCVPAGGPDAVSPDGSGPGTDADEDGLTNLQEFQARGHPLCGDTDMGGVPDGDETSRNLHAGTPIDDVFLQDTGVDTDHDGIADFAELTASFTDATSPDTDGDGLLDGPTIPLSGRLPATSPVAALFLDLGIAYVRDSAGYRFLGEADPSVTTDPLQTDDFGIGIPAGWVLMRIGGPEGAAAYRDHYELGRPAWWLEEVHGPWWGGADPLSQSEVLGDLRRRVDLDGDGIDDVDAAGQPADDLFPAANRLNVGREMPAPEGLEGLASRLEAQGRINPAPYTFGPRNAVPHPAYVPASDTREASCLEAVRLGGAVPTAAQPGSIHKGTAVPVDGKLTDCAGTALAGVPVAAAINGHAFGAGLTNAQGRFQFPVVVDASNHSLELATDSGMAFRGVAAGTVTWVSDPAAVDPGPATLVVRSGSNATLRHASVAIPVRVSAAAVLVVEAPPLARTGEALAARLSLKDTGGSPLSHAVKVTWDQAQFTVQPGLADGRAEFALSAVPPQRAGKTVLTATSHPPSGSLVPSASTAWEVTVLRPGVVSLLAPQPADAGSPLVVQGHFRGTTGASSQQAVPGATVTAELQGPQGAIATGSAATAADGSFAATMQVPAALAGGNYRVVARAPSTSTTEGAESETVATVRGIPVFAGVRLDPLLSGQEGSVAARLLAADGGAVGGARIQIDLGAFSATAITATDGSFELAVADDLAPGTLLQRLRFAGDSLAAPASHEAERVVASATTLTMEGGSVARGAVAEVQVHLHDGRGVPVRGAPISVGWGLDGNRTTVTDGQGIATVLRPSDPTDGLGFVNVSAWYAGDPAAGLAANVTTTLWSVVAKARIVLPEAPALAGGPAALATLLDEGTGAPLAGRTVTVLADGATRQLQTDAFGRFEVLPAQPLLSDPRPIRVAARFAGDHGFPAANASADVLVRSPVDLEVSGPPSWPRGQAFALHVNGLDARGKPVSGGMVTATVNGTVIGRADVQGAGVATVLATVPADAPPGTRTLRIAFLGSDTHHPAETTASLDVLRAATITVTAEPAKVGGLAVVHVGAFDGDQPLERHPVTLYFPGQAGIQLVTDDEGKASLEVPQSTWRLHFVARSAGTGALAPAAQAGVLVAAAPGPSAVAAPLWLAIGASALVVAAGLGSAALYRLRRHPLAPALKAARAALAADGPVQERVMRAYRLLEDEAIALEWLGGPAPTPRALESVVETHVHASAWPDLDGLIAVFERARYGGSPIEPEAADFAERCLANLALALQRPAGPQAGGAVA